MTGLCYFSSTLVAHDSKVHNESFHLLFHFHCMQFCTDSLSYTTTMLKELLRVRVVAYKCDLHAQPCEILLGLALGEVSSFFHNDSCTSLDKCYYLFLCRNILERDLNIILGINYQSPLIVEV